MLWVCDALVMAAGPLACGEIPLDSLCWEAGPPQHSFPCPSTLGRAAATPVACMIQNTSPQHLGLLNSKNSFTFPLELLLYCCRSA